MNVEGLILDPSELKSQGWGCFCTLGSRISTFRELSILNLSIQQGRLNEDASLAFITTVYEASPWTSRSIFHQHISGAHNCIQSS